MTKQSPRIYVYKITFDRVDNYYYGSHKEKSFNEHYMGSPVTHKDFWELYTPRKEVIRFFEYSDEGYKEARLFEDSLIGPVLNEELCLNEHVGGHYSLEAYRKGARITLKKGVGVHALTKEERIQIGKDNYERGVGIHARSKEQIIEDSRKAGKSAYEKGVGIHGLTKEKRVENGKKYGSKAAKAQHTQKWKCTETGYTSTAGSLTHYQKARGIDISNRIKVDGLRSWKINFEDGRVIVTTQSLKGWAEENNYSYSSLRGVGRGKIRNHKGIIKIVPL